jgi:GNAT superfamily N-acetyltransferase
MNLVQNEGKCSSIRLSLQEGDIEIGRVFLYIMHNDLHNEPFGLMEDVFISEGSRGQGLGTTLIKRVIELAKESGCYKLIATSRQSRSRVHELYIELGFQDHGTEFRIDL